LCGILISFYDGVKGGGGISCKNPRAVYCVATPLVIYIMLLSLMTTEESGEVLRD